jgi:hypothetical protein
MDASGEMLIPPNPRVFGGRPGYSSVGERGS